MTDQPFSPADLPIPPPPPPNNLIRTLFLFGLSISCLMLFVVICVFYHFSRGLPKIITVEDYHPMGVTRVYATQVSPTTQRVESVQVAEFSRERRYLIPYEQIPEIVVRAFISAEDDRFFDHPGINIASILRASIANFRAGHVVQGGSTITQQVAKSLLLTPERSFDRKIKEVILASRIEQNLTKQQILFLYLNQIYLGHGAYGVQAACKTYFNHDVSEITVAEAALLAGLPQAPSKYSPLLNPKRAKERQLYVLKRMAENKFVSPTLLKEASLEPIKIYHAHSSDPNVAPYYVEYVRKYLLEKYGEKGLYEEGLTIHLPFDIKLAKVAEKSLKDGLLALDKRIGYRGPLEHLGSPDEIKAFLDKQNLKLIEKNIPYNTLGADGQIDAMGLLESFGASSEADLIKPNEIYSALVESFDAKAKLYRVRIGNAALELPVDNTKWAKQLTGFSKGDVIQVSRVNLTDSTVQLEQLPQVQGALFSVDLQNGRVLAMVGGYDFDQSEFNRAIQAQRQCGSAFKPVIYSAALEKGFTPATVILDSPVVFKDTEGLGSWKPTNYEAKFYGDTTFRQALIKSRNIPTIKIVQSIQVPYLIQYAKRLGITSSLPYDLSIALGSTSSSLMDLTRLYALFPRLGKKLNPVFLLTVQDRNGNILEDLTTPPAPKPVAPTPTNQEPSPSPSPSPIAVPEVVQEPSKLALPTYPLPEDPDQVLDPRVAYVMSHLMKEVVNFGTGHEAKSLGRPAAGKTGTTNDFNDAWFVGFTPQVATGVWVGFDNQKTIGSGETGAKAALPIWINYMKDAIQNYPEADFQVPNGIVFATIDQNSGRLLPPNAASAIKEAFIDGTQPTEDGQNQSSETTSDFFKEDKE